MSSLSWNWISQEEPDAEMPTTHHIGTGAWTAVKNSLSAIWRSLEGPDAREKWPGQEGMNEGYTIDHVIESGRFEYSVRWSWLSPVPGKSFLWLWGCDWLRWRVGLGVNCVMIFVKELVKIHNLHLHPFLCTGDILHASVVYITHLAIGDKIHASQTSR